MTNLALLFPGQGSQLSGMGRQWFDAESSVRERFERASEVVGYSLAELCFNAPVAELSRTRHAQIALMVVSSSVYEVVNRERKLPIGYLAGHSLGEISALLAGGAMGLEDAVRLVKTRGEVTEACAASSGTGMIAVMKLLVGEVEKYVEEFNSEGATVQVSNYNSERQVVLSGTLEDLRGIGDQLTERGAKVVKLNVEGAFHSSFMADALPAYQAELDKIEFKQPTIPVCSSVTGRLYESPQEIRDTLATQLTSPVRWNAVMATLAGRGVTRWVEVGPKNILTRLVRETVPDVLAHSLDDEDSTEAYATIDLAVEEWRTRPGFVGLCMGAAAATRNRNFDDREYADGVIAPYRRLQQLTPADEDDLTGEQKREALDLLRTIMRTKRVPDPEQQDRIASILRRTGGTDVSAPAGVTVT